MKKSPRVLHLASWYPSRKHPTLGNFVQRHAATMAPSFPSVVLHACADDRWEIADRKNGELREVIVYFPRKWPVLSMLHALNRGYRYIRREVFHPDILHLHVVQPAGAWLLIGPRLPYLVTEHYSAYHWAREWGIFRRMLHRWVLGRAQSIVPVSRHLGKALEFLAPRVPQRVIGNVVDTRLFHPPEAKRPPKRTFRFLHLSSLVDEVKNIRGILSVMGRLAQEGWNFELHIGGDGDREFLEKLAEDERISKHQLRILPSLAPQEVAEEMRQADCFLLFSHWENQPVVLLEAMSTGLPIIASDVGGISEYVDAEAGTLVAAGDEEAFFQACVGQLQDHSPLSRKRHPQIETLASPQAIRESYTELYATMEVP